MDKVEKSVKVYDSIAQKYADTFDADLSDNPNPTIARKAAILYYGLIKNHPFKNGNKRTATVTLIVFLSINDLFPKGDQTEIEDYLVTLAKRVADSRGSGDKDVLLKEIENWLNTHTR